MGQRGRSSGELAGAERVASAAQEPPGVIGMPRASGSGGDAVTHAHAPLVSVIIIFLNAERFLREAIESVVAQTYSAWELILVDDGSTDRSTRIAAAWAAGQPGRVRVVEHKGHVNRGMSASRNLGVAQARGAFVAFLDADDVWRPHTLAEQMGALAAHPEAGMVYGPITWWYGWTGEAGHARRDFLQPLGVPADRLYTPPLLLVPWLRRKAAVPSGILVRRSVVDAVGGFEERFRGLYEDQAFCAKVCLSAPVYVSSRCWYVYRQHPNSWCRVARGRGEQRIARGAFLDWLGTYLLEQGITDQRVWRALERERWLYRHPRLHGVLHALRSPRELVHRAKRAAAVTPRRDPNPSTPWRHPSG